MAIRENFRDEYVSKAHAWMNRNGVRLGQHVMFPSTFGLYEHGTLEFHGDELILVQTRHRSGTVRKYLALSRVVRGEVLIKPLEPYDAKKRRETSDRVHGRTHHTLSI